MLTYLVQINYVTLLLSLFMLCFVLADRSFGKRVRTLFLIAALTVVVLTVSDSADYWLSLFPTPSIWRSVTSALGYTLRPLTVYCIALIVYRKEKTKQYIVTIPLILNAVLSLSSIVTGWVFSFNAENVFVRGVAGFTPFIVSGLYMLILVIWTVLEFRRNGWAELITVFVIALISALTTFMESALGFRFLLNGAIAVCLTAYYLVLHVEIYKRDALTNLLNRRSFYLDAERWKEKQFCLLSLDINNLKEINDAGGHSAGDSCITAFVNTALKNLRRGWRIYRTGGDEFMIIARRSTQSEALAMTAQLNEDMSKTPYSVSTGVAVFHPGDDFQQVCDEADARMYENKRLTNHGRK